jgi:hypothetical protein
MSTQITEPMFEYWETPKFGEMLALARERLREAQARFEASGEVDRRTGRKFTFESEKNADHIRRAEDTLELMRAELRRRAVECCVEDPGSSGSESHGFLIQGPAVFPRGI